MCAFIALSVNAAATCPPLQIQNKAVTAEFSSCTGEFVRLSRSANGTSGRNFVDGNTTARDHGPFAIWVSTRTPACTHARTHEHTHAACKLAYRVHTLRHARHTHCDRCTCAAAMIVCMVPRWCACSIVHAFVHAIALHAWPMLVSEEWCSIFIPVQRSHMRTWFRVACYFLRLYSVIFVAAD